MAFADRLAARLDRQPARDGAAVVGWRFDLSESRALRVGLKDSRVGGPYDPPTLAAGLGGGLVLVWSDGLHSYGNVDAAALDAFDERLSAWRESAFKDPYAPPLRSPTDYPTVATFDPAVSDVLEGDAASCFALLQLALEACRSQGATIVDAGVSAARGTRSLYSSTGIRLRYPETSFSFWVSADDLYSRGYGKRRLPTDDEIHDLVQDVAQTAAALRPDGAAIQGLLPVILPPDEAESFYGHFLGANLAGAAVVNGQSAFTLDDFRAGRTVAREDLAMWVDTLLDLEGAASPASAEGVPGGRADLIRDGRLISPVLDMKYAGRAAMPPTPLPRGAPGLLLRAQRDRLSAADLLASVERGVYVYSLLGMHTQDSTRGAYSLVAPQARVIEDGRLRDGKVKLVLAGDFLEHLRDERSLFATFPHEWNPGMLLISNVTAA